jgi:hypothetical protein
MTLYTVQEFLGVLLVVAISMATLVVLGISVILFQEAIRRARRAKARVMPAESLSPKHSG